MQYDLGARCTSRNKDFRKNVKLVAQHLHTFRAHELPNFNKMHISLSQQEYPKQSVAK